MKILGISTAGKFSGVAITDEGRILAEFFSENIRSENIVILIERILAELNLDIKDIEGIGAVSGPGSYSGLRGGLAAAKSFSQVLNVPVVGVSTLETAAYNLAEIMGSILVIMDAVRDEVNIALFSSDSRKLERITADLVMPLDKAVEFINKVKGKLYLISNILEIRQSVSENSEAVITDLAMSIPKAVNAAKIAGNMIKEGKVDDYLTIVPKYSHMPNVRTYNHAN